MNDNYFLTRILSSAKSFVLFLVLIAVFLNIGIGVAWYAISRLDQDSPTYVASEANLPVSTDQNTPIGLLNQKLTVNAQLEVNGQFYLAPSTLPTDAKAGTIVFDQVTNTLQYYDGNAFTAVATQSSIPQAAVASVQGQTGAINFTPGAGININGTTISSSGILGINGVGGTINVTTANGIASLSLPQDIAPTATPAFSGINLGGSPFSAVTGRGLDVQSGTLGVDVASNGGLELNGGELSLTTTCPDGYLLKYVASSWTCAQDQGGASSPTLEGAYVNYGANPAVINLDNIRNGLLVRDDVVPIGGTLFAVQDTTGTTDYLRVSTSGVSINGGLTLNGDLVSNIAGTGLTLSAGILSADLGTSVTLTSEVDGILPVANGGTGVSTFTLNGLLYGNGTSAIQAVGVGSTGECLLGSTGGAPSWGACPGSGGGAVTTLGGTTNRLSKFTGASTLGDANLSDNGTTISVLGSGGLELGVGSSLTGQLVLRNSTNNNTLTLQSGATSASYGLILPTAQGANTQCLKIDDAITGQLIWDDCIGGGGGSGAPTGVPYLTLATNGTLSAERVLNNGTNIGFTDGGANGNLTVNVVDNPTFAGLATFSNGINVGIETFLDLTGDGLQLGVGNTLETVLGTSITSSEIQNGTILFEDLDANSCSADQVIKRNPGNTAWVCGTDTTGSGTNTFATISAPNGTNPVADSTSDTLALLQGSGITITGDATADSITIASTLGTDIDLNSAEVTGTLQVGNGGTGATTFTANGLLYGNGAGVLGVTAAGTSGQCLLGNTGNAPSFGTCIGDGSGVTTVGALDGGVPSADGAEISTTTLFLQSASSTNPGLVNTTTQTFAGNKTFTGTLTVQNTASIQSAGGLTLGAASSATGQLVFNNSGNANTVTLRSGATSSSYTAILPASLGSINQCLKINNAGTGQLFWDTCVGGAGGSGGDVLQGGNSFGAAMTIGTNDNNTLSFETNSTTRLRVETTGNLTYLQNTTISAPSVTGAGYNLNIYSGSGTTGGGVLGLLAGNATSTGIGGRVEIRGGNGDVLGGRVDIYGGTNYFGTAGAINIGGGDSEFGTTGSVYLDTGGCIDTCSYGSINIGTIQTLSGITIGNTINPVINLRSGNFSSGGKITLDNLSNSYGTILVLDTKTTAGEPVGENGAIYYNSSFVGAEFRCFRAGAWENCSGGGDAFYVVAAVDSPADVKNTADYIADGVGDQVEINAALTAATGGTVFLAQGTFTFSSFVSIPNNTTLSGTGAGTTLSNADIRNADTSTGQGIVIRDLSIASGSDPITINGVGNFASSGEHSGALIDNISIQSPSEAIDIDNSAYVTISNSLIFNPTAGNSGSGTGITFVSSSRINVINNNITGIGYAIQGNSNSAVNIESNIVDRAFYSIRIIGSSSSSITNNRVTKVYNDGFGISVENSSSGNLVSNNIVSGSNAIIIIKDSSHNIVSDNIHNSGADIYIWNSDSNTVSGNKGGNSSGIIALVYASEYNKIINNTNLCNSCTVVSIPVSANYNYVSGNSYQGGATFNATDVVSDSGTGTIYEGQQRANGHIQLNPFGNVGIGTSTPGMQLTVSDTATTNVAQFLGSGATQCTVVTGTGWSCSSDERLKTNITQLDTSSSLDKILSLSGVNYNWKQDPNGKLESGFIAQQVQQVLPGLVTTDSNGYLSLNKDGLLPYIIGAIQEQQQQITGLQDSASQATSILELTSLSVSGVTTLNSLTVTTSLTVQQNLTVQGNTTIAGNLTVGGKIITSGAAPSAVLGVATGQGASYQIEGNDTAGTVTIVTGSSVASGEQIVVNFAVAYSSTPRINLTPITESAGDQNYYITRDANGFKLYFNTAPAPNTTYTFDYQILQ